MLEKDNHNRYNGAVPFSNEGSPDHEIHLYSSPISGNQAFYYITRIQGEEPQDVLAKLSPKTTDKILNQLSPKLRDLIFDSWSGSRDIYQLYDGKVKVALQTPQDVFWGYNSHNLPISIQEIVEIANIQYNEKNKRYTIHTNGEKMSFTEAEIAFAINQTPIYEGMAGICNQLVFLSRLHLQSRFKDISKTISMISEMDSSHIVDGAMSYYRRVLDALTAESRSNSIGVESEILAAYNVFRRIEKNNKSIPSFRKRYLHVSRELENSEIDVTVYYTDRNNLRVPVEMVETKASSHTFMSSITGRSGKHQMFSYFRECLRYPIAPYVACPLKIYLSEDQSAYTFKEPKNHISPQAAYYRERRYHSGHPLPKSEYRSITTQKILGKVFTAAKGYRFNGMTIDVQVLSFDSRRNRFYIMDKFTLY